MRMFLIMGLLVTMGTMVLMVFAAQAAGDETKAEVLNPDEWVMLYSESLSIRRNG